MLAPVGSFVSPWISNLPLALAMGTYNGLREIKLTVSLGSRHLPTSMFQLTDFHSVYFTWKCYFWKKKQNWIEWCNALSRGLSSCGGKDCEIFAQNTNCIAFAKTYKENLLSVECHFDLLAFELISAFSKATVNCSNNHQCQHSRHG